MLGNTAEEMPVSVACMDCDFRGGASDYLVGGRLAQAHAIAQEGHTVKVR